MGPLANRVELTNVEDAWRAISHRIEISSLVGQNLVNAKARLAEWINAPSSSINPLGKVQNRTYPNYHELALAIAGDVRSDANLATEDSLAAQTLSSVYINQQVQAAISQLQVWIKKNLTPLEVSSLDATGRYKDFYRTGGVMNVVTKNTFKEALEMDPRKYDVPRNFALFSDLASAIRSMATTHNDPRFNAPLNPQDAVRGTLDPGSAPPARGAVTTARINSTTVKETDPWTVLARNHNMPLWAGPSATTMHVLNFGKLVGLHDATQEAMAWSAFAFWNKKYFTHVEGAHRFHEVMDIAKDFGVPYTPFAYPGAPPSVSLSTAARPPDFTQGYADARRDPTATMPAHISQNYQDGFQTYLGLYEARLNPHVPLPAGKTASYNTSYTQYVLGYTAARTNPAQPVPVGHSAEYTQGFSEYKAGYDAARANPLGMIPPRELAYREGFWDYQRGWQAAAANGAAVVPATERQAFKDAFQDYITRNLALVLV